MTNTDNLKSKPKSKPSNILHIDSSLFGEHGVSSQLSAHLTEQLLRLYPKAEVTYHSLRKETDTETSWLRTILGFLGMKDVDFIFAEALNMSGQKESSIALAEAQIDELIHGITEAA